MHFTCRVLVAFATLVIFGCTTIAPQKTVTKPDSNALWEQQKVNNSNISSWALKAKIGVKTGKKGGSATLNWTYQANTQEIELYGPFGGGRIVISTTKDSATLKDTKGDVIEGISAGEVLYQRLGWQVPFTELIMWSRGLPNKGATNIKIDDTGKLKSLDQGIWHVEYLAYRTVEKLTLPRKLTITSIPGALALYDKKGKYLGDELSVKVILKRWREMKRNLNTSE